MGDDGAGRRRARGALPAIAAVGLGLLAWAVVTSPIFGIERVLVRGNLVLSTDRVVRLSGVEAGDNLVFLSSEEVSRRLAASPWIAGVELERSFPATLVIRITERRPVAWIETPDARLPVAGDGTVLDPDGVPRRLPSVGTVPALLSPGGLVPGRPEALRVAASLTPELIARVAAIVAEGEEVVLRLRPRGRVLYGTASAMARKNLALAGALEWARERGVAVAYIDVRVPERPALKPVGEASPTPVAPGPG
jgi:cell division protein FtsQ